VAEVDRPHGLVASFFTLAGSGFVDPPRHGFAQRCRGAADGAVLGAAGP
jgi:hypothetical protein